MIKDYEISSRGRVRSLKTNKILKTKIRKDGYVMVTLCNKRRLDLYVHRVVVFTYSDLIPNDNPTEKTEVNHINEDKTDNRVENLEWVTPKENVNHGTRSQRAGEKHRKRVLCVETSQVFDSVTQASQILGITKSNIVSCIKGRLKTIHGYTFKYVYDDVDSQKK